MSLLVEPGSNRSVSGALPRSGPTTCAGRCRSRRRPTPSRARRRWSTSTTTAMPPFAPRRRHLVDQRLLGLPLQRLVEREHDVGAALGVSISCVAVFGMSRPCWSCSTTSLPGLPREQRVVLVLEAVEPGAVAADLADERPGERARRVLPRRLGHEADAGQVELADLRDDVVADAVREVAGTRTACPTAASRRSCFAHVQDRRERGRVHDRVEHVLRVGVHRRAARSTSRGRGRCGRRSCRAARATAIVLHGLLQRRQPVAVAAQHLELRRRGPRARRRRRSRARCTRRAAPDARRGAARRDDAGGAADAARAAGAYGVGVGGAERGHTAVVGRATCGARSWGGRGQADAGRASAAAVTVARADHAEALGGARRPPRATTRVVDLVAQQPVPPLLGRELAVELVERERRLRGEHVERDEQEHRRGRDRGHAEQREAGPAPAPGDAVARSSARRAGATAAPRVGRSRHASARERRVGRSSVERDARSTLVGPSQPTIRSCRSRAAARPRADGRSRLAGWRPPRLHAAGAAAE